jgi:transposase
VTATRTYCETKRIICGVDVSSQTLDVRIGREGASTSFANDGEGIQCLAEFSREHKASIVVMEASGGYEQLAFAVLCSMGIEVAVVNARSVRRFAQAMDIFEKTDRIDAGVIAWYGETKKVIATPAVSPDQRRLKAMVTRLRQLIKGVADRTVARLMAELPEIGRLSNKNISKLVGLAPLADDSGKSKGKRRIYGGRRGVRDILYFIAGGVGRHNADFSLFQARLLQAGKAKRVIRIALAHKLLVRLNAKAREVRRLYQPAAEGCF